MLQAKAKGGYIILNFLNMCILLTIFQTSCRKVRGYTTTSIYKTSYNLEVIGGIAITEVIGGLGIYDNLPKILYR